MFPESNRENHSKGTPAATHMKLGNIGAEGEPFGGASTPWPPRCPHPLLLSLVPSGRTQLHPSELSPHRPFSTKQHNSPPPPQHSHRRIRGYAQSASRLCAPGSALRVPASQQTPLTLPLLGTVPELHASADRDPTTGSAAQLGPCPSPSPASRRGRRDRTARGGCPVLTASALRESGAPGTGLTGMCTRSDRLFRLGFFLPLLPPGLETSFFFLVSMAALPITLAKS